jgi:hypothetical protein
VALREACLAVCAVPGPVVKIRAGEEFEIARTTTKKYAYSIGGPFDNLSYDAIGISRLGVCDTGIE